MATNISEFVRTEEKELVNHPAHYTHGKYEHVEVALDWRLGGLLYNCTKYICRAGHKEGAEPTLDLRKGLWYLNKQIEFSDQENNAFGLARQNRSIAAIDVIKDWGLGPELSAALVLIAMTNQLSDLDMLRQAVESIELRLKELSK